MQIVIVGNGRMGRAVAALAAERGHAVRVIGREENAGGVALTPERLAGVDIAIEFTRPDAVAVSVKSGESPATTRFLEPLTLTNKGLRRSATGRRSPVWRSL